MGIKQVNKISLKTKINILKTYIRTTFTYGAQIWASSKNSVKKFENTAHMIRNYLNVKLREKKNFNSIIRSQAKPADVKCAVKKLTFKYVCHLVRENKKNKWNVITEERISLEVKRQEGRSMTR